MSEDKFVAYEYHSVPVKLSMETLYIDSFKSFGWALENSVLNISNMNSVILKFKRDRKLKNKTELKDLQRKCETALISIERLERSKTTTAMIYSLIIGVAGALFITGAAFSFQAGLIPLVVLLGVIGLAACALSYFVYNKTIEKNSAKINDLVDQQYDIIYEVCDQASKMLV